MGLLLRTHAVLSEELKAEALGDPSRRVKVATCWHCHCRVAVIGKSKTRDPSI